MIKEFNYKTQIKNYLKKSKSFYEVEMSNIVQLNNIAVKLFKWIANYNLKMNFYNKK